MQSDLAHSTGTRFFLNMGFMQKQNKRNKLSFGTVSENINNFKKTLFWPIFGFGGKKIFPKNLALPVITRYGFVTPCQNLEKNNPIPRKRTDR